MPYKYFKCQPKLTAELSGAQNDGSDIKLANSAWKKKRLLGVGGSKSPIQIHAVFA